MFQWFVSIFVIASGLILFLAWGRAIKAKPWIRTSASQRDWKTFRVMVLVALLCEIVLLVISLIGLPRTFAWLAGVFLIYFSVVFYFAVSFFRGVLASTEPGGEEESAVTDEMRANLAAIEGAASALRDEGAATADDLKKAAGHIVDKARSLGGLFDHSKREGKEAPPPPAEEEPPHHNKPE
jgi:uncharacterized iron-regulated membrane protein